MKLLLLLLTILSVLYSLVRAQSWGDSTYVDVNSADGQFRGRQFLIENSPVNGFFGIRYAEPPVGSLRWRRTIPTGKFDGVRDAFAAGHVCPQLELGGGQDPADVVRGDEDCLNLEVIVGGVDQDNLKPVVVLINNILLYRAGISHTGVMLAKREELAVVRVSARLGALGFLYDGQGTGNMGIWDHIAALEWVQRNIRAFGGDPDKVTIMGMDTGATIAQLLAATPLAKGLFQQIIAMSPMNIAARNLEQGDDLEVLRMLAGCSTSRTVTCNIDGVSADDIVRYATHSSPNIMDEDLFPAGFDDTQILNYSYLTGVTTAEEQLLTYGLLQQKTNATNGIITQPVMDDVVQSICDAGFTDKSSQCMCFNAIRAQFQVDKFAPYPDSEMVSLISSYYHSNSVDTLLHHARNRQANISTYAYIIDVTEDFEIMGLPSTASGTDKSIMSKLFFGYPFLAYGDKFDFMNREFYNESLLTGLNPLFIFGGKVELRPQSQDVMRYWANFIKTGDPSKGKSVDIVWPKFYSYDRNFLVIDDSQEPHTNWYFDEQRNYEYFNDFFYRSMSCIESSKSGSNGSPDVSSMEPTTTTMSTTSTPENAPPTPIASEDQRTAGTDAANLPGTTETGTTR